MTQQLDMRTLMSDQDAESAEYSRFQVWPRETGTRFCYGVLDAHRSRWIGDGTHVTFTAADAADLAARLNAEHAETVNAPRYI